MLYTFMNENPIALLTFLADLKDTFKSSGIREGEVV